MWFMLFTAADCAITALLLVYSSIVSYRDGWGSVVYMAVLLPFFLSSLFYTYVLWPMGVLPKHSGPRVLGVANVTAYAGIGVILVFTDSPVAWGVSLAVAGLFRPYNTAFISYFGFNDYSEAQFMAMYRLRVLFEFAGFILASFVSFDVFHFIADDSVILAIALFGIWILSFLGCLCTREDERTRFYRPVDRVAPVLTQEIRIAVNDVLAQSFIVETVRYSLIGYAFIILLTEVHYAPASLPVALMIGGVISFFGPVSWDSMGKDPRAKDDPDGPVWIAMFCNAAGYLMQLLFNFIEGVDSNVIFMNYVVAYIGIAFVTHLPAKQMYELANAGKFSTVSFVSLQLTVIHAGACVGCLAAIAIYKWFGCPLFAFHIILLIYFRHNDQRVRGQVQAFSRAR